MALLRVIVGPDVGATADVDASPVTIGRGPECELALTDRYVSTVHTSVEPVERGFVVRDLESAGGTWVNGSRVPDHQALCFGDIVKIGATLILFGSGNETAESETVGTAESPAPGDTGTR